MFLPMEGRPGSTLLLMVVGECRMVGKCWFRIRKWWGSRICGCVVPVSVVVVQASAVVLEILWTQWWIWLIFLYPDDPTSVGFKAHTLLIGREGRMLERSEQGTVQRWCTKYHISMVRDGRVLVARPVYWPQRLIEAAGKERDRGNEDK